MSREFYETRKIFREYLQFTKPYTYEEWLALPEDHKCAALYVQFFDEIILAWYNSKSFYACDQEGVETICQYLSKNVPILKSNPKRFTPNYIYRVAYNCLYCISHDRLIDKQRYYLNRSNYITSGSDTFDLFDILVIDDNAEAGYDIDKRKVIQLFWEMIDSDKDIQALVESILNSKRLPFKSKKKAEVLEKLKVKLEVYKAYFY